MVSTIKLLLLSLFAWFALQTGIGLYQTFRAPRCPQPKQAAPGAALGGPPSCFAPLFGPEEEVDIFLFLTTDPALRWWTKQGLSQLRRAPFWNASGLRFGVEAKVPDVPLPLSSEALIGVRRNETLVYAHCYLVRSGVLLEDAVQAARRLPDPGPPSGALGTDAVHASAALTRHMPYVHRQERKNLLSNLNGTEASDELDPGVPPQRPAVYRTFPVFGRVALHPSEALMWVGAAFMVGGFLPSGPVCAAARHIFFFSSAWLSRLYSEQEELFKQLLRRRAQESAREKAMAGPAPIMQHLPPLVQLSLGAESEEYDARYGPPLLYKEMVFSDTSPMPIGEKDVRYTVVGDPPRRLYVPPLAIDHFGLQQRWWRVLEMNESRPDPLLTVKLDVTGMQRYSVVETMKQSLKVYLRAGLTERDLEDFKDYLFRYPLHVMVLMQVIGFLQMTLTTLAFKNDITFFRGRADYTGLSSRCLATDTVQDLIIFLYLYDYEDISRLILFQTGTACLIGAWKYVRVARLELQWAYWLPWVTHNRGTFDSSGELDTEEIDARGMRYLKLLLYPLSAAWGIYNLYHYHYKSWWSWLVSSLADFAYTFGFINMMPQIFINYKLKSVAHMPWRVLMYKFFNTFIDDVFAFFIMTDYMTKKHRFMTLRDDIVFFIFLYQRYIYQVDPNRPDEFGFVYGEAAEEAKSLMQEQRKIGEDKPGRLADAAASASDVVADSAEAGGSADAAAAAAVAEGANGEATVPEKAPGAAAAAAEGAEGDSGAAEAAAKGAQAAADDDAGGEGAEAAEGEAASTEESGPRRRRGGGGTEAEEGGGAGA